MEYNGRTEIEKYWESKGVYLFSGSPASWAIVQDSTTWGKLSPYDYAYQVRQRNPSMQVKRITE